MTLIRIKMHTQILIAIVLGVLGGILLGPMASVFSPAADMFVRALRMMIVPLVFSSLVMGIVNLGSLKRLEKMGARALVYFVSTTVLAVVVGLVLVSLFRPGIGSQGNLLPRSTQVDVIHQSDRFSMGDFFAQIVPDNLVEAMVKGEMLPLIFFSILVGAALNLLGKRASGFTLFVDGLNEVMMRISQWIMALAPIGVFVLMAVMVGHTGFVVLKPLALFVVVVMGAMAVHLGVTLSFFLLSVKVSPRRFFEAILPALATAFTTSSSLATLPVTMDSLERRVGVSGRVTSFVTPLGATVTMDGTALYTVVSAVFIAQVYGFDLSFVQLFILSVLSTVCSISAAGVPSAGLVTIVILLRAVNLPVEGIGLILAVDRILDMFRTVLNVYGDACGAVVVARLEGEVLEAVS
jgi:Na+/H+-dicarboxylate symporter